MGAPQGQAGGGGDLARGDKRWASPGEQPLHLLGLTVPTGTPKGVRRRRVPPIPSTSALLPWDDVWIQHKTSGISINFWALQRLLTFHEMQREIEAINLAGRGGSFPSDTPRVLHGVGWVADPLHKPAAKDLAVRC